MMYYHNVFNQLNNGAKQQQSYYESIFDSLMDMVRVIDRDNIVQMINESMAQKLGNITGRKCYEILGCKGVCPNCISDKAIKFKKPYRKIEVLNGRFYSIISSPIYNYDGSVDAAVEVFRDITEERKLHDQIIRQNQIMQRDIDYAGKIQKSFLPTAYPNNERVSFFGRYIPCQEVGGDLYDVFQLDRHHIAMLVADVAGHGVAAAMVAVFLKEAVRSIAKGMPRGNEGVIELKPSDVLNSLYKRFNSIDLDSSSYITILYGILDLRDNTLTMANAGHNCLPILYNGSVLKDLFVKGPPINRYLGSYPYKETKFHLNKGDNILFYTDGLIEIRNTRNHFHLHGEEHLKNFIKHNSHLKGKDIIDTILKEVESYCPQQLRSDDIAMLTVSML
ncbi:MAG: SpoIIE family protein phosphatase [Mahellales bacterium]